jgi:5-methylthioribose kinase
MDLETLQRAYPGMFLLRADRPEELGLYLRAAGVLGAGEVVERTAAAGEGNMNCTVRAWIRGGSLVIKQARPWVEKYPQFAAPWERACREMDFYAAVQGEVGVAGMMPRLVHSDAEAHLLVLEDLGEGGDLTDLYVGNGLSRGDQALLAEYLSRLHRVVVAEPERMRNREMRELNHAHIFRIPWEAGTGPELGGMGGGLKEAAEEVRRDEGLGELVARVGREVYLADGPALIHGDFFPGSLIRVGEGLRVIDPEFGFLGRAEFDVGVWWAHLLLAGQPVGLLEEWRRVYREPAGFELELACRLAGIEMVRRLIGFAQLRLGCDAAGRLERLEIGVGLVREPVWERLLEGGRRVAGTGRMQP